MTYPKLCVCGHSADEHDEYGTCSHVDVKDFRIALTKRSNMKFCKCRKVAQEPEKS